MGRTILLEKPLKRKSLGAQPRERRKMKLGECEGQATVKPGLLWPLVNPRVTFSSSVSRHAPEIGCDSHMQAASTPPTQLSRWRPVTASLARTGGPKKEEEANTIPLTGLLTVKRAFRGWRYTFELFLS